MSELHINITYKNVKKGYMQCGKSKALGYHDKIAHTKTQTQSSQHET